MFAPFHDGVPCERRLRTLVNRVYPLTLARCFEEWIQALWPGRHDLIAIDGETARRTHDKRKGLKALHTLSAYATIAHLVLAQLSVPEKTNEIIAIPDSARPSGRDRADRSRSRSPIADSHGCQVNENAAKIVRAQGPFVLPLRAVIDQRRKRRSGPISTVAPTDKFVAKTTVEKGHGRIETRVFTASNEVDWIKSNQILSRPTSLRRHQDARSRSQSHRIRGSAHFRHAGLHFVRAARHRASRRWLARPLGRRKHALAARRRVQARSVALPRRPRPQEHGRHPTVLPRPPARQHIHTKRQNTKKSSKLEYRFPPPAASNKRSKKHALELVRLGWTLQTEFFAPEDDEPCEYRIRVGE